MHKITVALAAAAGYVAGTKAGRERYEQIKQQAQALLERPELKPVKERLDKVTGQQAMPYPESEASVPERPSPSPAGGSASSPGTSTGTSTGPTSGTSSTPPPSNL